MSDPAVIAPTTENRLALVEQEVKYVRGEIQGINASLQNLTSQFANIGKPNWSNMIALVGVIVGILFPLIAGGYFFVTLSTQNLIAPLVSKAERSETDRQHLNQAVSTLDDRLNDLYSEVRANNAKVSAQITEIETQFSSMAQLSNMRASGRQQLIQLLWQKVYGEPLPPGEFFYNMSQTRTHPGETQ